MAPSPSHSRPVVWRAADGLNLRGDCYGPADGLPVLFLHGGGQTRHAWGSAAATLGGRGCFAVALDQRGHGDSDWSATGCYGLGPAARDVAAVSPYFRRPPVVIGASLGGIAGLLAQHDGTELAGLVLVDIAHRAERAGIDRIFEFMRAHLEHGFASLEDAADAVAAYMPHRPRPRDLQGLAKNLRRDPDGRYRWHWDPRFVAPQPAEDPEHMSRRLRDSARGLHIPTLLVRGRLSDVVSPAVVAEFLELAPHAEYADVSNAAHMIAGDRNDAFFKVISGFVDRLRDRPSALT
jgi:pimeloyl-ACP methyl ester carboxylesterase